LYGRFANRPYHIECSCYHIPRMFVKTALKWYNFHGMKIKTLLLTICFIFAACNKTPESLPTIAKNYTLESGETLSESLANTGINSIASAEIVKHFSTLFNPRYCRSGDTYELVTDTSARWERFVYHQSKMEFYELTKSTTNVITAEKKTKPFKTVTRTAQGTIKGTLWEGMAAQGITPDVIVGFTDIFAWQIDFLTEPRAGDTFRVIWEQQTADDGQTLNGNITGAQYVASGREHTAVLFTHPTGKTDYYDLAGGSMRKAFLRAPLQFRRISSFFSKRRFHPVLKYARPHLGIDYAAPRGTPVSAVANGAVIYAGRKGGFGNYIEIKHANGYNTCYGHLNGYAKGIRRGARVQQGQLIGTVGSTGLSTGPHLDFRISLNGKYINYLAMKFPASESVPKAEMETFKRTMQATLTQLSLVKQH
jgi:murein DD-endopeptidase MepM/ murein hydrolase activator NlpD